MKNAQLLMMGNSGASLGYGYLYNWYAVSDVTFAPTDWKVPTNAEMFIMVTALGGLTVGGGHMKESGTDHWTTPNTDADNSSGLTIYGCGQRTDSGSFQNFNEKTGLYNSDEASASNGNRFILFYDNATTSGGSTAKQYGLSVNLLYTGTGSPTTVEDNDGNEYDVVLIGSQYWTVQQWKCTTMSKTPFNSIPNITDSTAWSNLTTPGRCAPENDQKNV